MPRERLSMRKVREVLRLKYEQGLSSRAIATSCHISVGSVHDYLQRAKITGLPWPLPDDLSDEALDRRLFPPAATLPSDRPTPDLSYIARELRRKGVTLSLLWEEYRRSHPDGYGYSRFCELYTAHAEAIEPRMRQIHKAGEKLFVDYAGMTMWITDRSNGELVEVQIFVATLGASDYVYAEATLSQSSEDWIASHVRAFEFFCGVPQILVPDNLKSAVTSACFYEPDINRTYGEMASYYGAVIIPARVKKPRDKAIVENHVKTVEQRILAPLRNRVFLSLDELNEAIQDLLDDLNNRPFQKMAGTRRSLFEELDFPALQPLPEHRYSYGRWSWATVSIDYHVEVAKCYYSVPYQLIQKKLEVRVSTLVVEIFHNNVRVASHARLFRRGQYSTIPEHMPRHHRWWNDWSPERLVRWASETGEATAEAVASILTRFVHPQQGYRSCLGIIALSKTYGRDRVEAACRRALACGAVSRKSIQLMLKNNLENAALPEQAEPRPALIHANIRGAAYYGQTTTSQPSLDL
jgi:transposase